MSGSAGVSKKLRKNKAKTVSFQEFTAGFDEGSAGQNVIYTPKSNPTPSFSSSWADEVEEYEQSAAIIERIVLPSAPRAVRGPLVDERSVPLHPPFKAHLGNISYELEEGDIVEFFNGLSIGELRLPKDPAGRLRGFGYVEFRRREDLVSALGRNEEMLNGRPIRVTLGLGSETKNKGSNPPPLDDTPTNWRSNSSIPTPPHYNSPPPQMNSFRPPIQHYTSSQQHYNSHSTSTGRVDGRNYGRGESGEYYESSRAPPTNAYSDNYSQNNNFRPSYSRAHSSFDSYETQRGGGERGYHGEMRGGGPDFYSRPPQQNYHPRDHDRGDFNNSRYVDEGLSRSHSYEIDERGSKYPPPSYGEHGQGRRMYSTPTTTTNSTNYTNSQTKIPQDSQRNYNTVNSRPSHSSSERVGMRVAPPMSEPKSDGRERKKLILVPRTKSRDEEEIEEGGVSSSSIFGGAKPVDTSKREREIEKKLAEINLGLTKAAAVAHHLETIPPPSTTLTQPPLRILQRERSESSRDERGSRFKSGGRGGVSKSVSLTFGGRRRSDEIERDKDTNSEPEDERDLRILDSHRFRNNSSSDGKRGGRNLVKFRERI